MVIDTSNLTTKVPAGLDATAALAKGLGTSEKSTELVKEVAALLGGRNVSVNAVSRTTTAESGTVSGATGVPTLDNPDDAKAAEADLEKLLAYLMLDNEKRQAEMAQERIGVQKDSLERERADRSEKIEQSLKDMDKAAKSRKRNGIFGWLMAAVAVVVAVVACVASGGVAVGAVVGACVAVGAQVLSATGAMDKIVEGVAEGLEKLGMKKEVAQIVAQVALTVAIMAATIGAGAASAGTRTATLASSLGKALQSAAEAARPLIQIGAMGLGTAATISSGIGAYDSYKAGMSQSEVTETEKFLTALRQRLEESQEELQAILEALQNGVSQVANIIASATDTNAEIANRIGDMA